MRICQDPEEHHGPVQAIAFKTRIVDGVRSWQDNHLYDGQQPDGKGAAVSP